MKATLLIPVLLFSQLSSAAVMRSASSGKTFYVGTGATFFNMGKVTSSDDASTSMFGQIYVPLTLAVQLPLDGFKLMPEISFTPLAVKASDSISKRIFTGSVSALFGSGSPLSYKTGLGLLVYYIGGDGGPVTRSNGSSTSTFYLPGTTHSSTSFYVDLGMGYTFGDSFRADLDILALGALTTRRAFSSMITLSKGVF